VILLLAAVPFAIAADKTVGEAARKDWSPHAANLQKAAGDYHFSTRLVDSLRKRLVTNQTNTSTTEGELVVELRLYRLLLRTTHKDNVSLEAAVQMTVRDTSTDTVLWQNGFVCSFWNRVKHHYSRTRFETPIDYPAESHSLEDYKFEAGVQLLQTELDKFVNGFTEEIGHRIEEAGLIAQ